MIFSRKMKTLSFCTAFALSAIANAKTSVTLDLDTQRYIGGVSKLDRSKYFNIHGGLPSVLSKNELNYLINELNVGSGRGFYSPFTSFDAPYPSAGSAKYEGKNNIRKTKKNPLYKDFASNNFIVTDHPKKVYQAGENPVNAAKWAANYFKHYFDDETRPLYYEPMNEPFVHSHEFGIDGKLARKQMTDLFKEIGKRFDQEGISTKVIGYSSAWPSMELKDFSHFNDRMKYFMDVAGPYMDSFSVHPYDGVNVTGANSQRSGSNLDAILDLMETYSHFKWNKVKPITISEYGGIEDGYGDLYSDIKSIQSVRSINNMLFQLLNRQDRLLTTIPFITPKSPWYYSSKNNWQPYGADLLRPDPRSIKNGKPTKFFWTPRINFYKLWSNVGGVRVKSDSSNPDIQVHTFVNGKKAYVALNSLADVRETVDLTFINDMAEVVSIRKKSLEIYPNNKPVYKDQKVSTLSSLSLVPGETVVLEYTFVNTISPAKREDIKTYYSDQHLQKISANKAIKFNFNNVSSGSGQSLLKFSIGRKHNRSKKPRISINGHSINVPNNWAGGDQRTRNDFFGAIKVPFNSSILRAKNSVEITFPDSGGRVSSVVLEVRDGEDIAEDIISFTNSIITLPIATNYPFNISYSANQKRDIVLEMWKGNKYLTSAKVTVDAGSGTETINLKPDTAPQAGEHEYLLKLSIRPVGTDWEKNIDIVHVNNISVEDTSADDAVIEDGTYAIISRFSGKAVDVKQYSKNDGGIVHQWDYFNGPNQKWKFTRLSDDTYKIINQNSGKALDIRGARGTNGAQVHQWEYYASANQQWVVKSLDNGYFSLTAVHSGKALDASSTSTKNGASVQQWQYHGGANQQWKLELQ